MHKRKQKQHGGRLAKEHMHNIHTRQSERERERERGGGGEEGSGRLMLMFALMRMKGWMEERDTRYSQQENRVPISACPLMNCTCWRLKWS